MDNDSLKVVGLCKSYRNFNLNNISLNIPQGAIMGFVGPNGAGKTTTLKSILGMIKPDTGAISFWGDINPGETHEALGIVPDYTLYEEEWTVDIVNRVVRPFYRNWKQDVFDKLLKNYNIDKNKRVKELSRGMNVKLMLAVALSHDAKLLVLDEPTSGLDPVARDELCELLSEYVSDGEKSILFSTHITTDLDKIASHITFILDGKIVFSEEKNKVKDKYVIVRGDEHIFTSSHKKIFVKHRVIKGLLEGVICTENVPDMPKELSLVSPTLDELVVFISRRDSYA